MSPAKRKYKDLIIATGNRKKKEEILRLLGPLEVKIWSLADYPELPKVGEDGNTFDENAIKKAVAAAEATGKFTLAEDSGLEVDALDGEPGIYSARFSGEDANDEMNNAKLLKMLKGLPWPKRKAQFRCSVALVHTDGKIKVVRGYCKGYIGFEKKGKTGFGYDPVFVIPRYSKTFAELGSQVKDRMSHRAMAMKQAKRIIMRAI